MGLTHEQRQRLEAAIVRWSEPPTPYMAGQCLPRSVDGSGGGVDCVRYADALLQEVYYGSYASLDPLPREAQDSAWHNPEIVSRVTRLMFERFDLFSVKPASTVKPADFLCVRSRPPAGLRPKSISEKALLTPHHCIIVGADGIWCWHAVPGANIVKVGIGGVRACYDIIKIWRSRKAWNEPV